MRPSRDTTIRRFISSQFLKKPSTTTKNNIIFPKFLRSPLFRNSNRLNSPPLQPLQFNNKNIVFRNIRLSLCRRKWKNRRHKLLRNPLILWTRSTRISQRRRKRRMTSGTTGNRRRCTRYVLCVIPPLKCHKILKIPNSNGNFVEIACCGKYAVGADTFSQK